MSAQKQGMIATYWLSDVAFIQGIHDYNDIYVRNTASTSQRVGVQIDSS